MEWNKVPRNNLHLYGKSVTKEVKIYSRKKTVASINGVRKIGKPHSKD